MSRNPLSVDTPGQPFTTDTLGQPAPVPDDASIQPSPPDMPAEPAPTSSDMPAASSSSDKPLNAAPHDMLHQSPPPSPVFNVRSAAELERTISAAQGPVVVDFVQEGCGACDEETLDELARQCESKATFIRADITKGDLMDIAEKFEVDGTPTTLLAKTPKDWQPGKAKEVNAADPGLRRTLKCAVPGKK